MARLDERLVIYDQNALGEFSQECFGLYPLSPWDVSVIMSSIRFASWNARWLDGNGVRISSEDFQDNLTLIESLERRLMSNCLDDLVDVMQDIRDTLSAGNQIANNCCGSSGPTFVIDGENTWYGTEIPLIPPTTFGGTGEFDNEASYLAQRCLAANNIVAGLVLTLNGFSVYTLASLIAGGAIVAFFVGGPPLSIFIILAGLGFAFGGFYTIAQYVDSHRYDLVCMLYTNDTYAAWVAALEDWVHDLTISLSLEFIEIELTEIFKQMVNTDTFNTMFTPLGLPPVADAVDCSACGEGAIFFFGVECGYQTLGEILSGDYTGSSVTIGSQELDWSCDPETPVQAIEIKPTGAGLEFVSITSSVPIYYWSTPGSSPWPYQQSGLPPTGVTFSDGIIMVRQSDNTTPFSITCEMEVS